MVKTRLETKGGPKLTCVGDICVTEDGKLEVHIDTSDPRCALLTEQLAKRVIAGEGTQYVFDKPSGDVEKAPRSHHKG
ncbi:MAG: hypothetical protein ACREC5_07600 [Thermoplasmata archaeon]